MISTKAHAAFDYALPLSIAAMATSRRLGWPVRAIMSIGPIWHLGYTLLTRYEGGLAPKIGLRTHLACDGLGATTFIAAGLLLRRQKTSHRLLLAALGLGELAVVAMTERQPSRDTLEHTDRDQRAPRRPPARPHRPGRDLAVSRAPHHTEQRASHPDLHALLRDSFRAAERQLESHKVDPPQDPAGPSSNALIGQVAQILPGQDHGFILNNLGTQLYFHRDSLTRGKVEDLSQGDAVHYVEEVGGTGPIATKVWPA